MTNIDETPPANQPGRTGGLTRREWLWTGAGVLLALAIIGLVAALTGGSPPPTGLTEVDREAPDITLDTLDGRTVSLRDLRGKIVLVNFWATWCEPCKTETPDLVAAASEFKSRNLEIIGINLTDQDRDLDEIRRFVQRYAIPYPILLDPDQKAQDAFGIYPIPTSYFIDSEGRIRYTRITVVTRADIEHVLNVLSR
ncbi:MAG TPA: TlpA disulfide reductase family protein [Herpetosiphonaceae bacterium]|nr:TlpA disulfide reductase family protein [Herpetosiphonaceae bacterium]